MHQKTSAIVLSTVKFNDSTSIITVFTSLYGRVSFSIQGMHRKKSPFKAAFFQPLSLVEVDFAHQPGREIQRMKDVRMKYIYTEMMFSPVKNALALFLSDFLFRVLRQADPDELLFAFVENSLLQLDAMHQGIANFHLVFMLRLARYLGFGPNAESEHRFCFDMLNGVFQAHIPPHSHYLAGDEAAAFYSLLQLDYGDSGGLILNRDERNHFLDVIIEYYRLHLSGFQGVQSVVILQSVFD